MPCDYSKYPENWKTYIVPMIAYRSLLKCEWCGVLNYSYICRAINGKAYTSDEMEELNEQEFEELFPEMKKAIKVILTVAHLDHDLSHNDGMDSGGQALPLKEANLVHLCQKCHNNHDAPYRAANRKKNDKQMELGL